MICRGENCFFFKFYFAVHYPLSLKSNFLNLQVTFCKPIHRKCIIHCAIYTMYQFFSRIFKDLLFQGSWSVQGWTEFSAFTCLEWEGDRKKAGKFFFITLTAAQDKIAQIVSLHHIWSVEKLLWEKCQNKKASTGRGERLQRLKRCLVRVGAHFLLYASLLSVL